MRPISFIWGNYTAAVANSIALTQTPLAAGDLALAGALATGGIATLVLSGQVTITSAGNDSGKTFTIYGTNNSGSIVSEAIAGGNAAAVTSVLSYKTITRIAVSAATAAAVTALQASIGSNLGELLAAVSQLCADVDANVIDEMEVSQYYAGVVGVMGWDLSDAMWNAQPVELLEKFRWAMANDSSAAIPAISAISSGLRALIKYASAPANMSENELAPLVGVQPWKLRLLRAQKAKWHPDQLAAAARLLALADRSSKGTVYDAAIPGGRSLESAQTLYHIEKEFMAIRAPKV